MQLQSRKAVHAETPKHLRDGADPLSVSREAAMDPHGGGWHAEDPCHERQPRYDAAGVAAETRYREMASQKKSGSPMSRRRLVIHALL